MKIIIACEFSGIVRDAFIKKGHEAISCDLLKTEKIGPHIQGDIQQVDLTKYDLMIAHPPCTHLAVSGARWFKDKDPELQKAALEFVKFLMAAPVKYICLENPVSIISSKIKKPTQIIHPWQFGDHEQKTICLWLKNLPKLQQTDLVPKWMRDPDIHREPPGINRWKNRSRFFKGIADAMATQWGNLT